MKIISQQEFKNLRLKDENFDRLRNLEIYHNTKEVRRHKRIELRMKEILQERRNQYE